MASLTEGTHIFAYDATVDADATGPLTNLGCVDVDQNDALVCDEVTVRVPTLVVDKAASLDLITISGPANAPVATPSVVTWTLTYTLTDGPVTNAVISDEIPVGFVFLDAANGGTETDGVVTWTFAELTTSGSVTFRTTVDPATISLTAPTVNTAIIDSDQTPEDEGQDSVTVTREERAGRQSDPGAAAAEHRARHRPQRRADHGPDRAAGGLLHRIARRTGAGEREVEEQPPLGNPARPVSMAGLAIQPAPLAGTG